LDPSIVAAAYGFSSVVTVAPGPRFGYPIIFLLVERLVVDALLALWDERIVPSPNIFSKSASPP